MDSDEREVLMLKFAEANRKLIAANEQLDAANSKLKEYEQDVKKIDTNTQLEISRLTERVKEL